MTSSSSFKINSASSFVASVFVFVFFIGVFVVLLCLIVCMDFNKGMMYFDVYSVSV